MMRFRGALAGAAFAFLVIAALHYPSARVGVLLISLFLALTACVYLGALLAQRQRLPVITSELGVGLAVFTCAALGAMMSAAWLAAGYALHGVWDWAHDSGFVSTNVTAWFPPACAMFDFLIAAFVLLVLL